MLSFDTTGIGSAAEVYPDLAFQMRQQIGFKQGALAPLAASGALFGGFLLIKYLPWINLQTVSNAYFFLIGSAAVTGALLPPLRHAVRVWHCLSILWPGL